ncbi:MAG TPA: DUF6600 domain-containing protein [Chthoniobacterales bacterium]|nr:DUF6600 domain-containing protein [Chthoniobacterales bacterium]
MKIQTRLTAFLILASALQAAAGTLSYVAVSPVQSDVNCGIDSGNQYTTAVDGGNASGNDRVINGVRLYSLIGSGQSASADNCALNALTGTLGNSQVSGPTAQADGIFAEVLSDMVSNDGAADNSQQEIVLDPASLTASTTYDLRIYIANSGAQDREVNLAFVGDGQPPVETGFFNEEDARTSPGAFRDPRQAYYIDYRFTWDGTSTPGATITQKSGQAPFVLYAMTNQPVIEEAAAAPAPPVAPAPQAATTALVSAVQDQVGVTSDTFYSNPSLKKHGRWIEVKKYGRCWQPTDAPPDWRPYSRGHFGYSDDGGYVWISDASENEWGWATYHYGRWCRVVGVGSGWAWVPGTAWSGAWVSWRQGRDREHGFVGWAPLPPEATLRVGVGISTWADREYDIGPDYYTFVNVRDFGSDSYWRPGLIVDRRRYVDILPNTVNITNINYTDTRGNVSNVSITQVRAYNGGPDFTFINTQIRQSGGREISRIQVSRVGTENFNGGIGSRLQGNTFTVFTPQVTAQPNPRVLPQVAATVPDNKIDHGWADVKDQKLKTQLRNDIAQQTKGQTPETTKAVLPPQVIQAAAQSAATTASPSQSPQPAGVTTIPTGSPSATATNQVAGAASPPALATSPAQSPSAAVATTSASPAASQPAVANKGLHPGQKLTSPAVATGRATAAPTGPTPAASGAVVTSALSAETQQSATPKVLHPGAKVESKPAQSPAVATNAVSPSPTAGLAQSPAGKIQHPGEKIVSAPGQSPAPIRTASATPTKPAAVTTTQATPSPAVGLHPGAKIAPTIAHSPAPAVTGVSASPVVPTQSPRGAVTAASPSPTAQPTRPVVGRQNQQRGQIETKPAVTPAPSQAQVASTPPQPPVTARTPAPARAVEAAQTPPPVQTPAVTKKVTVPAVTREPTSPPPSGPSQQQLQQQQIEERIRQQQQQKQQEQAEQKIQQQQTQQRQQQQLEQEQKLKQQEQKQAQQKAEQAQAKQQEAAQQKQQQLQQQQAEQKRESQLQAQKQQEAAQQKERQLQQQKQQEAQQKQAEQKKALQQQALQKQQEAAQQKERQAQQLKEQQAQQRQQELKQEQARQKAEQQQQLKQQQLQQQQAEQKQQQLRQQQMEQQAQQQQRQQQQSQQQNRRAATPTPSPSG